MPPIRAKTIRRPREDPTIEDPTLALDIYTRCVLPEEGEDLMEQLLRQRVDQGDARL